MEFTVESLHRAGQFIPTINSNKTLEFYGTDTEELYNRNLSNQPADWHYRSKPVSYEFNSNGYRSLEWDQYDWSSSIVLFGCSRVFGVGVAGDETIDYYLNRLTGRPVINLGVASSSCWVSYHNSQLLYLHWPRPYAVVQLWTETTRLVDYRMKRIAHLGAWNTFNDPLYFEWNKFDVNADMHVKSITTSDRIMWSNTDTKYRAYSMFRSTSKSIDCEFLPFPEWTMFDKGRDLIHSGSATNQFISDFISSKL